MDGPEMKRLAEEFGWLSAAATPGVWRVERIIGDLRCNAMDAPFNVVAESGSARAQYVGLPDAEFIAFAGTHRAVIEAALRAVADSAPSEETPS